MRHNKIIMRRFELLFLLFLTPGIFILIVPAESPYSWQFWVFIAVLVLGTLHLLTEKHRWQMYPAYVVLALILLVLAGSFLDFRVTMLPTFWRFILAVAGIIFWALAIFLAYRIPIFKLPAPTGPHQIGTTFFAVENNTFSTKNQSAVVVIQVWYPAQSGSGRPAPYLPHAPLILNWLRLVPTNSFLDAPPAVENGPYPLLIFGHGGGSIAAQNTIQMEELASHGYVVCTLSHPIDSAVFIYPDGSKDGRSFLKAWQEMRPVLADNNKAFAKAAVLKDSYRAGLAQLAAKKAVMRQILAENQIALEVIERRTNDTLAVIQYLVGMQNGTTDTFLTGMMEMDNLGVFGHSNGGAVAVNTAAQSERVKAVLNMDGYPFGDILDIGLKQPYLSMSREGAEGRDEVILAQALREAYRLTIKGTSHLSFMDIYFWFRQPRSGITRRLTPRRAIEVMNAYTLAFFNKHLKNKEAPLMEAPSNRYPEAIFETYITPSK